MPRDSEARSFTHEDYLSAFTWRYGSAEMRHIWSEVERRRIWRRIWVALAEAQCTAGLVSEEELADLRAHSEQIDLVRAEQIEAEIHHDLMAELRTFAEQAERGGRALHLGATSMDIVDNADVVRIDQALELVLERLRSLGLILADQIDRWASVPTLGMTHLQPAEPTTMGHRLARYGQDLLEDFRWLVQVKEGLRAKGVRGAVGTAASFEALLRSSSMTAAEMEAHVMKELGLRTTTVSSQVYPRKQDYRVLTALASLGGSLYRMAFDLRILQSPPFGEWAEPFGRRQVGSSAMPFKRNPIRSENVCSLARLLATLPRVAWDNAAHCLLERTLDDSANRRSMLPEAFLCCDEILIKSERILRGLRVSTEAAQKLLDDYGVFAATEKVLMEASLRGGDRQALHEVIRSRCQDAWDAVRKGAENPLAEMLVRDAEILRWLEPEEVRDLLRAEGHLGLAPESAREMAREIRVDLEIQRGEPEIC